ncbi:MAG: hypothetical protein ACKVRP_06040 [Bacteroidota bacterium]
MKNTRSPYDLFNAKLLTPEQVAATFVIPDDFDDLWKPNSVLLMGPRGSGKTTLLKMLTVPALRAWKNRKKARIVMDEMASYAVYVPTDIHWYRQLLHSKNSLVDFPQFRDRVSEAAVTSHILNSLRATMADLIRWEFPSNSNSQTELCEVLIKEWRLTETIPVLSAIEEALVSRIHDIETHCKERVRRYSTDKEMVASDLPNYYDLDYFSAVRVACTAFDHLIIKNGATRKWALCFDELEYAPSWLQDRLLKEIKGSDERFLFKLTTTPILASLAETEAEITHDFTVIRLWAHEKKKYRSFCARLTESVIKQWDEHDTKKASDLFGRSPLEMENNEYQRGSELHKSMIALAKIDRSFRQFLERHQLSPTDPTSQDPQVLHNIFRKAKPIVMHRLAHKKVTMKGKVMYRGKPLPMYHGVEAIYDISDGNPRRLIWIISELMRRTQANKSPKSRMIPVRIQSETLMQAAMEFMVSIQALPDSVGEYRGKKFHVSDVLETIGEYFQEGLLTGPFTIDPIGTFVVDISTPKAILDTLWQAVYRGAIVFVDPKASDITPGFVNKRFRLSYLLAVRHSLPLRLYSEVALSKCIVALPHFVEQRKRIGRKPNFQKELQESLFEES